ncbi:uncharacterized protein DUF2628 [Hoeflea halophila]|uniref:Uncharacterized protein DUF2628 n=1 Tax=Hoeflea halophila TaxID=714899 RepID=A0A286ICE2_9HYPH|nr:DUF2628 domain-containing protein [Hoeflea halophila]SOE16974.1 uncharacterized protein DUF2628 [Hoeflea halophila]
MTAYLVLARPGAQIPDERSVIIADRFAPLAFVAPVIWLLFNRLWLEAVAALLVMIAATMLSGSFGQPALGLAISLGLSLITAMEGRSWRAAALQRRGWRLVDVVETDDADLAFDIHARQAAASRRVPDRSNHVTTRQPLRPDRQPGNDHGSIGLVPVERN